MHNWSDDSVDWNGINSAVNYISDFCRKWARMGGQAKEKFGTVRFYTTLGWRNFLHITHPGYVHYGPYPKWLLTFDIYYGYKVLKYTGLAYISYKWHCLIYRQAYKNAIKKWPHLKDEITCCADYSELLKGL